MLAWKSYVESQHVLIRHTILFGKRRCSKVVVDCGYGGKNTSRGQRFRSGVG